LLTGLGKVSILAMKKYFLHQFIYVGSGMVWMAPLADMVFFAMPGLLLFLLAWRWPRLVSLRVAIFTFAFLSFMSLLSMEHSIHFYARLLLAAGLAAQGARVITRPRQRSRSLVRWVGRRIKILMRRRKGNDPPETGQSQTNDTVQLPSRRRFVIGAGATVAGLAVGVEGWRGVAEHLAMAALPPASHNSPNVLLLVLDTVRAQSLSLYGYHRPTTPHLERLAKAGVCFEQAISTAPWTLPSHASMFTGRSPYELFSDWTSPLDNTYPTLAEVLKARGYVTAGFVANLVYCTRESGLDRGFVHYEDFPFSSKQLILSASSGQALANSNKLRDIFDYHEVLNRKTAATLSHDFLDWLSRHDQRPFFAFLNYFDAHEPYLPPEPFDEMFGPKRSRGPFLYLAHEVHRVDKWKMSPDEIQVELDAYEGTIAYLDNQLGVLFDELDRRGALDNTVVIVTSDHGEEFGEHGVFSHGHSLYLPSLRVPLLISFPSRIPSRKRVHEPVSLRDLPATVVDLIGLDKAHSFPGESLARYWDDSADTVKPAPEMLLSEVQQITGWPQWYPNVKGAMKSLVYEDMHYIKHEGDGREELYDFESDSGETQDLSGSEEGRRTLKRFRSSLHRILGKDS
jgi:arylsulfatase A-like enzyme